MGRDALNGVTQPLIGVDYGDVGREGLHPLAERAGVGVAENVSYQSFGLGDDLYQSYDEQAIALLAELAGGDGNQVTLGSFGDVAVVGELSLIHPASQQVTAQHVSISEQAVRLYPVKLLASLLSTFQAIIHWLLPAGKVL